MLRNVFLKSLWEQRIPLAWWALGIAALTVLTVLFYPSIKDSPELDELLGDSDIMRAFVGDVADLTSPEGFLNSQLFFLMVPVVFLVFAIATGSGSIAAEEQRGTLDILLSNPLTRSEVLAHKFAAMIVSTTALAAVLWVSVVVGVVIVDMDISLARVAEATVSATLLGTFFGALALALGCATGGRGLSVGVSGAVAVVAYFINALRPVVEGIEPTRYLTPFYYYIGADPLTNGLELGHVAVLVGATLALFAIAALTFERRDLAV